MKHINTNSESSNLITWRFRQVSVSNGEEIEIPRKAKCLNLRSPPKKDIVYLEWIEPLED